MKKEIQLKMGGKTSLCKIEIGSSFVFQESLPKLLSSHRGKVALICDNQVGALYEKDLSLFDIPILSFPAGEKSKNRGTKEALEDRLLSIGLRKDGLLISFGGGVTSDLAGFVASTYCRGISYIQIPTSLLGMIDATIGGKTGINTPYGKNMIGTIYPAEKVWIDLHFLDTLPPSQWINGLVEMIKSGLIASPALIENMKSSASSWKERDQQTIERDICCSISIKGKIIKHDPLEERGLRRILNLGHTFGHAIELFEDFQIAHGEAVAIGILTSCFISRKKGLLQMGDFEKIESLFRLYKIPLTLTKEPQIEPLIELLTRDKKGADGAIRMVLLEKIGKIAPFGGSYCTPIERDLLEEAIEWMHREFYEPSYHLS